MRPWLALRWAGIGFDETVIPLGGVGYGKSKIAEVLAVSPSGKVPALEVDGVTIWDSLAICEWAHEQAPQAGLWPTDSVRRALARSAAAEMHSGFAALRRDFSMNIRRRAPLVAAPGADALEDVARVQELWTSLRTVYGDRGPFLLGARSIADAMFTPVATRFRTYGVALEPIPQAYVDALLSDQDFMAWEAAAEAEPWSIASTDAA